MSFRGGVRNRQGMGGLRGGGRQRVDLQGSRLRSAEKGRRISTTAQVRFEHWL